jgi:hypothetical protein
MIFCREEKGTTHYLEGLVVMYLRGAFSVRRYFGYCLGL